MNEKNFDSLLKQGKDQIKNFDYAKLKDFVTGLTLNGAERSDEDFSPIYSLLRKVAVDVKNNPKDPFTHFAAFENAERGVVLVIFKFNLYERDGKGFMKVSASFVENATTFNCPHKLLDLITDSKAENYKKQVNLKYPLEVEEKLRLEYIKDLIGKKPSVKLTQKDLEKN